MSVIWSEGKCCSSTWVQSHMPKMNKKTKEKRVRYDWIKHSLEDFLTVTERFQLLNRENTYFLVTRLFYFSNMEQAPPFLGSSHWKTFEKCVCKSPETAFKGTAMSMEKLEWDYMQFPTMSSDIPRALKHILMMDVDFFLFQGQHELKEIHLRKWN